MEIEGLRSSSVETPTPRITHYNSYNKTNYIDTSANE